MVAAKSYQQLSIQEKRALDVSRVRDAALRCPDCQMAIMPADLLAHLEQRCAGKPEPGAGARWVTRQDALVRRVPKQTLSDWVKSGLVRARGPRMDREYLLGDLVDRIARWRGFRRR